MLTFYSFLNCDENATVEELKHQYFELLRQTHPDKTGDSEIDHFVRVNLAWKTLGNATSKKAYDDWICEQRLREIKELVGSESFLETALDTKEFEELCRCGGIYFVEPENLERIIDFALIECSNCSLCLRLRRIKDKDNE